MPELRRAFFEGPLRACNILTIILRIQSLFAAVPRCFKNAAPRRPLIAFPRQRLPSVFRNQEANPMILLLAAILAALWMSPLQAQTSGPSGIQGVESDEISPLMK